ncbi:Hypothetical protein SRAE_X000046200 [Strongyloides ratti]|uniref:Uncharacterized protein n=1 Tax=Strongyloides ratti TaxID=34506 RepID=A0A090LMS1_STRRB|nr:Hypothetical protein SRAE_X000046200 [Strongyloides ratti]CEF71135.1 Hypothetical protein SRAE_X000046200 [Strongyloides ratti]
MFVSNIILLILISYLHAIPQDLYLEFSKDEENNHRYSIDSLEPELAITIFSNLPINPQKRTTVRPMVKKIKKKTKSSSEINYLVRVKRDSLNDMTSPDYANLNNDFLNTDDIMFSYDENIDEMKQVKSFDANFLHQTINKNVKQQQVFVNDKSTINKKDKKIGDIETVTVILPSQDIQIDKEEKNWEKIMNNNFEKKNSNEMNDAKNDEDKTIDTNDFDDFFDNTGAFTDDSVISTRKKRDNINHNEIPNFVPYKRGNLKNGRKIRMGYSKIEVVEMTSNKLDATINKDIIKINSNFNLTDNIKKKDNNNKNITNFQNTKEVSEMTNDQENTILNKTSNIDNNKEISSSFLNNNITLLENDKHKIFTTKNDSFNNDKNDEIDIMIKEDMLIISNQTINNTNLSNISKNNDSINNPKLDSHKSDETKFYWKTFFNNGTTRKEMFTENINTNIQSTTALPFFDEKNENKTEKLLSNNNTENSTTNNIFMNGIENIATFPNDFPSQDDFTEYNSVYSDIEIIKHEKPIQYKTYSMDLPLEKSTKNKTKLFKNKKIIRKIHNSRSSFIRPF